MSKGIYIFGNLDLMPLVKGASKSVGVAIGGDAPSSNVTVTFAFTNGWATSSGSMTFTIANYATPQTLILTGVTNGIVEGFKLETLVITASGGGYNVAKNTILYITDTGLDQSFLSGYNWKRELKITGTGDITTSRAAFQNFVFSGAGMPTDATMTVTSGYTGSMHQTSTSSLVGASSVDRCLKSINDPNGDAWNYVFYHIKKSASTKCCFVYGGHGSEGLHVDAINKCLAKGYNVMYCALPQTQENTEDSALVLGTGVSAHNGIVTSGIDRVGFSALELFIKPPIIALNYLATTYLYTEFAVTGCSGGGLMTLYLMAIDTRFVKGLDIRGYTATIMRVFTNDSAPANYDAEQGGVGGYAYSNTTSCGVRIGAFFLNTVTFMDLIILASSGGRVFRGSHHAADSCCHRGFSYNLYNRDNWYRNRLLAFGCDYDFTLNTNALYTDHKFHTNDIILLDALLS